MAKGSKREIYRKTLFGTRINLLFLVFALFLSSFCLGNRVHIYNFIYDHLHPEQDSSGLASSGSALKEPSRYTSSFLEKWIKPLSNKRANSTEDETAAREFLQSHSTDGDIASSIQDLTNEQLKKVAVELKSEAYNILDKKDADIFNRELDGVLAKEENVKSFKDRFGSYFSKAKSLAVDSSRNTDFVIRGDDDTDSTSLDSSVALSAKEGTETEILGHGRKLLLSKKTLILFNEYAENLTMANQPKNLRRTIAMTDNVLDKFGPDVIINLLNKVRTNATITAELSQEEIDLLQAVDKQIASDEEDEEAARKRVGSLLLAKENGTSAEYAKFELTREYAYRMADHEHGDLIIMTFANYQYKDFVINFISYLQKAGVDSFLIGCMDTNLLNGRLKVHLIAKLTSMGLNIVFSDIDVVWLRNPLPYFNKYPEADILSSTDMVAWYDFVIEHEDYWDQYAFADILNNHGIPCPNVTFRCTRAFNDTLRTVALPVSMFASGHTYYTQDLSESLGLGQPYAIHNTFQYSRDLGKRHRFRERMLWDADPSNYYDSSTGFITFDFQLEHVWPPQYNSDYKRFGNKDELMPHFNLVHAQLTQIREAVKIAYLTQRILILPPMYGYVDKWWSPHDGVIPGVRNLTFPRVLPADYFLDLEMMAGSTLFNYDLWYREYSFFNNPKVHPDVKSDKMNIKHCWRKPQCPPSVSIDGSEMTLRISKNMTDVEFLKAMEHHMDQKIWHFPDIREVVKDFVEPDKQRLFNQTVQAFASIHCCAPAVAGNVNTLIHYDMFADVPHTDRFQRNFTTWYPRLNQS